jgi:hypothetical protein
MIDTIFRAIEDLKTPLAVGGFVAALFFLVARKVVAAVSATHLSAGSAANIIGQILRYFFYLSLACCVFGFVGWVFQLWIEKEGGSATIGVGRVEVAIFAKYGISEDKFQKLAEEHAVTTQALSKFFEDLGEKNPSREKWPEKLAEFSQRYKQLNAQIRASPAQTPADIKLKDQGIAAVARGELDKAARISAELPSPPENLRISQ